MGMDIHIETHQDEVTEEFRKTAIAWLHEAGGELLAAVRNNQRVRTGKTRQSWRYEVDESRLECVVASDSQNAIWEEFGTGEYALNGNGRKGGWWYVDEQGKRHFTRGKRPIRPLYKAYMSLKNVITAAAQERFRGLS
ncbi:MAG: HK97 gp10 family phage protein [Lachnospiraceae bacterium]|nr:HK97 gp10 family phage protein [Lachnospiraceae bacterium]